MENEGSVVKTEINLSKEDVGKIITAKVAEIMVGQTEIVGEFVDKVLHHRRPKKYSSDPDNPTLFESVIEATLTPLVKDTIERQFSKKYRKTFEKIIAKELANIFSDDESQMMITFKNGIQEAFSKFQYYVRS